MFIIYGWRDVAEKLGEGQFHCPGCRRSTSYEHQQMRTYVTIFFIPIIPLAAGARVVTCQQCKLSFMEGVLAHAPSRMEEQSDGTMAGDRVLGKMGEYWYPGTSGGPAGKKIKVTFFDGRRDVLAKSNVIPLDLQKGDPVFVKTDAASDFRFATILDLDGTRLQVQFEDGRKEWAKLGQVRVLWEDTGDA